MKTKIYGTIGPACCDTDTLVRLYEKGMTGIRINLSHSGLKEAASWLENIRNAGGGTEILMDLRGPELRIGKIPSERFLSAGDRLTLLADGQNNLLDPTEIPVPGLILPYLKPGQSILLDDGNIQLEVEELLALGNASCKIVRGGTLKSKKSIALTDTALYPPTLTECDLENIASAYAYGITGVMLPFVRSKEDLLNLKAALKAANTEKIRIFAKIENLDGVDRLPELLPYCDEVVIARGDLGNAMPLWKLPVIQRQIADCCRKAGKPFMIVTQMLASMEHSAVPTRAEVSDIFRAVTEGADSVMLTGETAAGEYPVQAMEYLVNTVREAEMCR